MKRRNSTKCMNYYTGNRPEIGPEIDRQWTGNTSEIHRSFDYSNCGWRRRCCRCCCCCFCRCRCRRYCCFRPPSRFRFRFWPRPRCGFRFRLSFRLRTNRAVDADALVIFVIKSSLVLRPKNEYIFRNVGSVARSRVLRCLMLRCVTFVTRDTVALYFAS